MKTLVYYNTARLAREMKLHQSHVQRLVRMGVIERPDIVLKGIGTRPPQAGYSIEAIRRIATRWKATH